MLDEYMRGIGFSDLDITIIKNTYPLNSYQESTLLYNLKVLYNYFSKNNFNNSDFINLTLTTPVIISKSIEDIKKIISLFLDLKFNRMEAFYIIKTKPHILEFSLQNIKTHLVNFFSFGFNKDNIIKLIENDDNFFNIDCSDINKLIDFFKKYDYSNKSIISIITDCSLILNYNVSELNDTIMKLKNIGFDDWTIIKITTYIPDIFKSIDIFNKFKMMIDFGFTKKQIISIINKVPILIMDRYLNSVFDKLNLLLNFGFSNDEVIMLICENPYIILYSIDHINYKYKKLSNIFDGNINTMLVDNSLLFAYDIILIEEKVNFLKSINLFKTIIKNSSYLSISFNFIKARYNYFFKNNLSTFKDLFLSEEDFFNKYSINTKELIYEYSN